MRIDSPTSFRCLELLGGASRTFSFAIINSDIERVATERVKTDQHTMTVVPTEGQDLLLNMMGVCLFVFVNEVLSPVVNL